MRSVDRVYCLNTRSLEDSSSAHVIVFKTGFIVLGGITYSVAIRKGVSA